jgi:prepilin-type processing-associated H-X9-DG protein
MGGFANDCPDASGRPDWQMDLVNGGWNGIVAQRAGAKIKQIVDGTSNTILAGEKYLPPVFYETVTYRSGNPSNYGDDNPGDNSSMWQGYDKDTVRAASDDLVPLRDTAPRPEERKYVNGGDHSFGSAHNGAVNVAHADGSVHAIEFEIDPIVWEQAGNRQDGI